MLPRLMRHPSETIQTILPGDEGAESLLSSGWGNRINSDAPDLRSAASIQSWRQIRKGRHTMPPILLAPEPIQQTRKT